MSKLRSTECELCGSIIWGKGQTVIIEGAKMIVCPNCAQYGKRIVENPQTPSTRKPSTSTPVNKTKSRVYDKEIEEPSTEIAEDYAIKIHQARMRKNLTQEKFAQKIHERGSLIRRIEAGKIKPPIPLARKIEKFLGIKIVNEVKETPVDYEGYLKKSTGSNLGDIAFIKKKK